MSDTPNLQLPYIMAAQAQKHVTHNEAIRALDAIVQIGVADRDLAAPPVSPADGDRYIVGAGATGAWAGKDGQVAAWQDGAWMFYAPLEGWLAWVADEDALVAWDGSAWGAVGGGGAGAFTGLADTPADYAGAAGKIAVVNPGETALEFTDQVPLVGVNATADATNRLAVASEASLFNHAGAGHQHKINKNAAGDTASILFQTGFSGRAEFGTTGDDDWHVKVSPDGTTWYEALVADKDTGRVGLGTAGPARRLDVLDASGPQLRLTNTDGVDFADLEVDGNGNLAIAPSGGAVGVYADNVGGEVAGAAATIEQDGGGDTVLQWLLTATRSWYAGIDNSDGDKWKLASTTGTPDFGTDTLVTVQTDGRVGIGTTSPGDLLHLHKGASAGSASFRTSWTDTASYGEWNAYQSSTFMGAITIIGSTFASPALWASALLLTAANNNVGSIIFRTKTGGAYQERLLVTNAGNVGIGTTSPSTKLDVDGPVRVASYTVATVPNAATVGAGAIIYVSDEAGGAVLAFSDGTAWRRVTDRAVIS